jgi:hypothetical protein
MGGDDPGATAVTAKKKFKARYVDTVSCVSKTVARVMVTPSEKQRITMCSSKSSHLKWKAQNIHFTDLDLCFKKQQLIR